MWFNLNSVQMAIFSKKLQNSPITAEGFNHRLPSTIRTLNLLQFSQHFNFWDISWTKKFSFDFNPLNKILVARLAHVMQCMRRKKKWSKLLASPHTLKRAPPSLIVKPRSKLAGTVNDSQGRAKNQSFVKQCFKCSCPEPLNWIWFMLTKLVVWALLV